MANFLHLSAVYVPEFDWDTLVKKASNIRGQTSVCCQSWKTVGPLGMMVY